ncbi:Hemolysin-type calcium-binding region [hydrothermal vent metagenome]|uniref:Hemolysin-type calcium-binding region n=1 Tax=hydrothermal vent metagenome TaxID=652676 RepID=A0A1W1C836_9ZZZZ
MSTTVSLGSSSEYTMSFDIQPRDGGGSRGHKDTSDMRVTFGGKEMSISSDSDGNLTVDGDSSISIVTHTIDDGWTRVEARYDGISGDESELLIEGTGAEDTYGMLLDNIKIVSSASVSVTVEGTESGDTLIANDTIDRYSSGDGDDVIFSGSRDDHIDGGAGVDRVVYSGSRDDYAIFKSLNDKYVIEDKRADATDGTDTVVNVEEFTFADGTVDQANLGATNRAIVVDGIVGGLEYVTSSGLTGYTQDDGSFDYLDGDTVTFKLGSVTIGDIDMGDISDEKVFLQDIADVDRTDMNDEYVENMAVLLQSLDSDSGDNIIITEEMRDAFSTEEFDLATISEDDLKAIIEETGRDAVSEDDAMEHVQDMLVDYTNLEDGDFDDRVSDDEDDGVLVVDNTDESVDMSALSTDDESEDVDSTDEERADDATTDSQEQDSETTEATVDDSEDTDSIDESQAQDEDQVDGESDADESQAQDEDLNNILPENSSDDAQIDSSSQDVSSDSSSQVSEQNSNDTASAPDPTVEVKIDDQPSVDAI